MEQKDYLKRQIDEAGRVLGKVIAYLTGLNNEENVKDGIEKTDQTLQSELGIGFNELIGISKDQFINTLLDKENLHTENFEDLAELLNELGDRYNELNNQEDAKNLYEKALLIYEYLEESGSTFSFTRHTKMDNLKNKLG
jgi:hypothetical protein